MLQAVCFIFLEHVHVHALSVLVDTDDFEAATGVGLGVASEIFTTKRTLPRYVWNFSCIKNDYSYGAEIFCQSLVILKSVYQCVE